MRFSKSLNKNIGNYKEKATKSHEKYKISSKYQLKSKKYHEFSIYASKTRETTKKRDDKNTDIIILQKPFHSREDHE